MFGWFTVYPRLAPWRLNLLHMLQKNPVEPERVRIGKVISGHKWSDRNRGDMIVILANWCVTPHIHWHTKLCQSQRFKYGLGSFLNVSCCARFCSSLTPQNVRCTNLSCTQSFFCVCVTFLKHSTRPVLFSTWFTALCRASIQICLCAVTIGWRATCFCCPAPTHDLLRVDTKTVCTMFLLKQSLRRRKCRCKQTVIYCTSWFTRMHLAKVSLRRGYFIYNTHLFLLQAS